MGTDTHTPALSDLTDLYSALDNAHATMAMSSQDWAAAPDFAWLYGILVGWSDDPSGGDVDQGDALGELASRFGWSPDDVDRLRRLRAAVAGFDLNRAADLDRLREESATLNQLFDLQWTRMTAATSRWRAEDPEARALTMPDLGDLLQWLMDDADRARAGIAVRD